MKGLKLLLVIILIFSMTSVNSQVGVGTTSPDPSSVFDVTSTDKGVLIPRISLTDITTTMLDGTNLAATGLLIYNTNASVTGGNGTGYYYFNGTIWEKLNSGASGVERIDDLIDGKSDNDGSQDGSSIFLGINAGLNDDSSDNRNIGIGFETLQAGNNGYNNSAIGYQSLYSNTTGSGNAANGYQTLSYNTIGNWNVANGNLALYSNVGGNNNTANGNESLYSNTNGYNNTANGYESMFFNTTGHDNTASGLQSMYTNTLGENNTAFGVRALYLNTEGNENAANGNRSLYSNTNGNFNTANGSHALNGNTIGNFNTATGYQSLLTNSVGINNVATGSRSLYSNASGSDNVANGFRALDRNVNGNHNNAIGSFAQFFNVGGSHNLSIGYQSLLFNSSGSYNIGIGSNTGASNASGSNNIYLGHSAGTPETGSNKLYIENSGANANNALIYGEFDTNILRTNSEFQIGNPTGTGYAFPTVDGTANQIMQTDGSGFVTWIDSSSISSEDHDFYEEGSTVSPDDINDDIFTQGNLAIGKNTADYALDIEEDSETRGLNVAMTNNSNADNYSAYFENLSTGTGEHFGIRTYVSGSDKIYGSYNQLTTNGSGYEMFGTYNNFEGTFTSNGPKYGVYNNFENFPATITVGVQNEMTHRESNFKRGVVNNLESNGISLGVVNDIFGANSAIGTDNIVTGGLNANNVIGTSNVVGGSSIFTNYASYNKVNSSPSMGPRIGVYSEVPPSVGHVYAGYFRGKLAVGTTVFNSGSADFYVFPESRGTANQIMQTDGSGNVSWVDTAVIDTDNQNISGSSLSGTTLTIGIEDGTSETVDLSSLTDNDWYEEGTTNSPNNINDDIYTQGNVAIGKSTADFALDVQTESTTRGLNVFTDLNAINTYNYAAYFENSNNSSGGSSYTYGIYNEISGTNTRDVWGFYNHVRTTGLAPHYGTYNELNGTGTGTRYGVYNALFDNNSSGQIGVYNALSGVGIADRIGVRNEFNNGLDTGDHYGVYNTDNTNGIGDHYGVYNNLTGGGDSQIFGSHNLIGNFGNGNHFGTYNEVLGGTTGNDLGDKIGSYNLIRTIAGGQHYGVYSEVLKPSGFAGYFLGNVSIGTTATNNYVLPSSRGTANQIMQTNASGQLSWVTPTNGDINDVVAGDGLTGGGTNGTVTLDVVAQNGMTANANNIVLGGTLTQATTITQGTNDLIFNLNSTGEFIVQDSGTNHFEVRNSGNTYIGGDTYWNDINTTGTIIAALTDDGDDGRFRIYENGATSVDLDANSAFTFNAQGLDRDFRIESDDETSMFRVDAGNNRIGVMEATPNFDIHLKQSNLTAASAAGIALESSATGNNWKIYHSGANLSFAENGIKRGHIENGSGLYVPTSDRRLKKSITEVESILDKVNQLKTYRYLYKDQDLSAKKIIGFMAQDVQPLFPELVSHGDDDYLGLNYSGFGVLAIKAIQEQQDIIDAQQQQIETLQNSQDKTETLINSLLKRIEALENQD